MRLTIKHLIIVLTVAISAWIGHDALPAEQHNALHALLPGAHHEGMTAHAAPLAAPTVTVTPASVDINGTITVAWSGIASPSANDWIGLYPEHPADENNFYLWMYVSCTQAPGSPAASGSCSVTMPGGPVGKYQFKLYSNDGFTLLGSSPLFDGTSGAPPPAGEMIEGVPVCTDHNKTTWHALTKKDGSGNITCTYGHEHHDNPATMNDVFGPVSGWYGGSQTISYPWQTSSDLGAENDLKHNGYKWYTNRDMNLPCAPNPDNGCIIAYRAQVHAMGTATDAVVRFHSFSEEALVEMNGQRGIFRWGGFMDTGHLALRVSETAHVCPPLPTNPPSFSCGGGDGFRENGSANPPSPHHDYFLGSGAWYGHPLVPVVENWGPIDYNDPSHQLFAGEASNNSRGLIGDMPIYSTASFLDPYASADGKTVTASLWTDRNRQIVQCTAIAIDCFPIRYEAMPRGAFNKSQDTTGPNAGFREFDEFSPVTGKSLIRFPN